MTAIEAVPYGSWEVLRRGSEIAILAVGTMVRPALEAAESLAVEGFDPTVVNCRFLKPYDALTLSAILADHRHLLVVEEGTVVNGFGAYIATVVERLEPVGSSRRCTGFRIGSSTPRRGRASSRWRGLDAAGIAERVRALHESEAVAG